jgi:uncharacterized membrane protein
MVAAPLAPRVPYLDELVGVSIGCSSGDGRRHRRAARAAVRGRRHPAAVMRGGRRVQAGEHLPERNRMASTVEQSIEVDVPVDTAYNQWTQFESFPKFMDNVVAVYQTDDSHLHWIAEFGGTRHEWDAEITEQTPDQRIAWKNTDGKDNAGVVSFHRLGDNRTRIMVQMDFVPEGMREKIGEALGMPERHVAGDLERFKTFIESRGTETGAWRGEVG